MPESVQQAGSSLPRTWHHRQFRAADLVDLKHASQVDVAVVIPARNEEATVGAIVTRLRRALMEELALVDELVVVDSESEDDTAAVAADAGARVVHQSWVLPEAGPGHGKGEALWKGLAVTSADLVVFLDADVLDFDERFVVGLLGPLLTRPDLAFVKAAYDRPFQAGGELRRTGGGRVTELLARPLLAAFWPELSWLAQPLAGECAARRWLLEHLPFVQGYGVEFAMLADICQRWSPDVIAQVDLDERVHKHQQLDALGTMSAEILHVAMDRLSRQGRVRFEAPLATLLPQPVRDEDGRLDARVAHVQPRQRPPLAEWRRSVQAGPASAGGLV